MNHLIIDNKKKLFFVCLLFLINFPERAISFSLLLHYHITFNDTMTVSMVYMSRAKDELPQIFWLLELQAFSACK